MTFTANITPEIALGIIKKITKKVTRPVINFDGTIILEIGDAVKEYTLRIEGSWVLDNGKQQLWSQDFVTLRDEEKIEKFIGVSQISGVNLGDKHLSFVIGNGVEINVMNFNPKTNHFFTLTPHIIGEDNILVLNSDFEYSLNPLVDMVANTISPHTNL